jgi:hypothetical protein
MELNPSWEAASSLGTQELPNILWNPEVHHRVHKSPRLVPILSQIYPIHTTPFSLRSILILSTHLRLRVPSCLFPSGFPTNILYAFLSTSQSCYIPCPSHPPLLDHSNYTWRRLQVMKFLIMQFSPTSRHFIALRSKYFPQHTLLKHPQSMFLPSRQRPSFTTIQNQRQNYSFVYPIFYIFRIKSITCVNMLIS